MEHIYNIFISGTPSSGTYAVNTGKITSGLIKQILIKSASTDTTFDFQITDFKNNIIYATDLKATGVLRVETEIPIKEVSTLTISNASSDELFTGRLAIQEF